MEKSNLSLGGKRKLGMRIKHIVIHRHSSNYQNYEIFFKMNSRKLLTPTLISDECLGK